MHGDAHAGWTTAVPEQALRGVLAVFTHENAPRLASFDRSYQDEVAPPGSPFHFYFFSRANWTHPEF